MAGLGATAAPLGRYVDQARVIVISAPASTDPAFERQAAALRQDAAGLRTRDLVVVRALGRNIDAQTLRRAVNLPADRFGVALVGKDGGVKLRSAHPISAAELFQTIDAMPMRRDEMRRSGH